MGTTEHEEPRFFFILNKGAKSGGEITHAVLNGSIVSKPAGWDAFHGLALAREKLSSEEIQQSGNQGSHGRRIEEDAGL